MQLPPQLLDILRKASRVTVLTGAGISADSGIPTFRDPQHGLWSRFRPEDLANAEAFKRDPALVWGWYEWRREAVRAAEPNPAHLALATLEHRVPGFTLITQNVDGLHARAGSRKLVELHGNIMRNKCFAEGTVVEQGVDDGEPPPKCPRCGGPLRPDVVWFGEALDEQHMATADKAARECELFLVIGTSAAVMPAAHFPRVALQSGAVLVEINRDETPLSAVSHAVLRGPAALVLPHLLNTAWPGN
ncbi:MAG TPA: NAD-dependent deacylase [Burkholderiales bacterium]|nr:NAD-dependent deacylase [Burkholderiales bacterium]